MRLMYSAIHSLKSKLSWGINISCICTFCKCQLKYHSRIQKCIGLTDEKSSKCAASMIESIRLLENDFDIKRISCTAHTLQLVIKKALTCDINIKIFILRVKMLVYFLNSPKQLEYLITVQEQLNYLKIYRTVKDVQNQWNSPDKNYCYIPQDLNL